MPTETPNPRINPPQPTPIGKRTPNRWHIQCWSAPWIKAGEGEWMGIAETAQLTGLTHRQLGLDRLVSKGWLPAPVEAAGGHLAWNRAAVLRAMSCRVERVPEGESSWVYEGTALELRVCRGRVSHVRGSAPEQALEDAARHIGGRWVWLDTQDADGWHTVHPWGRW